MGKNAQRIERGIQCDARKARLARGFEVDDRWFGLGDRGRYLLFKE